MAKTKFVFDKTSGTLKAEEQHKPPQIKQEMPVEPPHKEEMSSLDLSTTKPNVDMNENIVQFRESSDMTIFQITEERSGRVMMVIAGYGLEIKFNMAELRTTERIEQLLGGLSDLFRRLIVEQALKKSSQ